MPEPHSDKKDARTPHPSDVDMDGVYRELHAIAARCFEGQGPGHTLQPTALAHEAFLRLMRSGGAENLVGAKLLRMAAAAMRSVLVDHARRRQSKKRQASGHRVALDEIALDPDDYDRDILTIDRALDRLAKIEPQWRLVVELRFFGGCSEPEIAQLLGSSTRTVQRQWRMAKAWLYNELDKEAAPDGS